MDALPTVRWGRFDSPRYQVAADGAQQPATSGSNLPPPPAGQLAVQPAVQGGRAAQLGNGGQPCPWGIAPMLDDHIWVGDGWGELHMDEYLIDGSGHGPASSRTFFFFGPADFTLNTTTGRVWVVDVYGSNCIHEVDPAGGATGANICPPWVNSQRGLAYDGTTGTGVVGLGRNDGMIHRFNAAGELLDSRSVGRPICWAGLQPGHGALVCDREQRGTPGACAGCGERLRQRAHDQHPRPGCLWRGRAGVGLRREPLAVD